MRVDNIFHRVSKKDENTATELLANLMQLKYFRDSFLEMLDIPPQRDKDFKDTIKKQDISTQYTDTSSGRPDLVIKNDDCLIYIENKTRLQTSLQPTQTTLYLEDIEFESRPFKKMVFLVPDNYCHLSELKDHEKKKPFCKVLIWQEFLDKIYKKEFHKWNSLVDHSLNYLSEIIRGIETKPSLNLEEVALLMNPKDLVVANSLFYKFHEIFHDIDARIVNNLGNYFSPSDWAWGERDNTPIKRGKYINFKNERSIFYGFSFEILEQFPEKEDYLFGVAIHRAIIDPNAVDAEENGCKPFLMDEWYYLKLDKYGYINIEEPTKMIDDIVVAIKKFIVKEKRSDNIQYCNPSC